MQEITATQVSRAEWTILLHFSTFEDNLKFPIHCLLWRSVAWVTCARGFVTCRVAIVVFVFNLGALFRSNSYCTQTSNSCCTFLSGSFKLSSHCLDLCVLGNERKIFCGESSRYYFRDDISPLVTLLCLSCRNSVKIDYWRSLSELALLFCRRWSRLFSLNLLQQCSLEFLILGRIQDSVKGGSRGGSYIAWKVLLSKSKRSDRYFSY